MSVRDLRGPAFLSKRNIGTATAAATPWVRPSNWLALPDVTGLQKFVGLHAVYPDSNFVALSAEGNFTVNYGDGSGDTNISSGVTTERNIAWADAATTSDVGIAGAVGCTFTDAGDTVDLTAHGWSNGQQVAFNTITSTTGISTYTTYYIVNKAANTFQVATTIGGTALTLTTNGSGNVYVPQYRQVIITVVPNGGNLTKLNLHIKHSTTDLQAYSSGFLDIAISAANMTDLRLAVQTPGATTQTITHSLLQSFSLIASDLRQLGHLFYLCRSLENIGAFVSSSAAAVSASCTFTDTGDTVGLTAHGFRDGDTVIFTTITSTTGITKDTAYFVRDVATDTFKVASTYGGTALTLTTDGTGTALRGTNGTSFFQSCSSLATVPLFNLSAMIIGTSFFQSCSSLITVPLFNLSAMTIGTNFFYSCSSLTAVPLFNLSTMTNGTSFLAFCSSLTTVPLFNLSAMTTGTTFFNGCSSLATVPLFNLSVMTNGSNFFSSCSSLTTVPLFNLSAMTTGGSFFSSCSSLRSAALQNMGITFSFASCELSAAELNKIYTNLPTVSAKTVTVTGNWGVAADDPTIATGKGWTVTG